MAKESLTAYPRFMHPRNRHVTSYDLRRLSEVSPKLAKFVFTNDFGIETIDFSDQSAVLALNQALLKAFYAVSWWELPAPFLCPPIPGRADYIHTASDLFTKKKGLRVLDIGVGANCVYPLIGHHEYGWTFVGSEVNQRALANARKIVERNGLQRVIELRPQLDPQRILANVIQKDEDFDLVICNPPFHGSRAEALASSHSKWKKLATTPTSAKNFGGSRDELWCPGGERAFISRLIRESAQFQRQVRWFTALISQEKNLFFLKQKVAAVKGKCQVLKMDQGQKKSRLITWTFGVPTP